MIVSLQNLLIAGLSLFVTSCSQPASTGFNKSDEEIKKELLDLETKWLEYEFALDTGSVSKLLHDDFISISAAGTSNKQMELDEVYKKHQRY
jgi:hypothetical protein